MTIFSIFSRKRINKVEPTRLLITFSHMEMPFSFPKNLLFPYFFPYNYIPNGFPAHIHRFQSPFFEKTRGKINEIY
jgi:hypothetical protein